MARLRSSFCTWTRNQLHFSRDIAATPSPRPENRLESASQGLPTPSRTLIEEEIGQGAILQLRVTEQMLCQEHGLPERYCSWHLPTSLQTDFVSAVCMASHRMDQKLSNVTERGKRAYPAIPCKSRDRTWNAAMLRIMQDLPLEQPLGTHCASKGSHDRGLSID